MTSRRLPPKHGGYRAQPSSTGYRPGAQPPTPPRGPGGGSQQGSASNGTTDDPRERQHG